MPTREFRHSGHVEALGKDLWELRSQNVATDSRLMSGTECFPVHSCVLACNSPYLEHFFQTQTSTNPVFVLPRAEPKSVMHLIEFMYTGETQVEMDQLTEFGELANLLDVRALKDLWPLEDFEVKKEVSYLEDVNSNASPPKNRARGGPKSKRKPVSSDLDGDSSMDFDAHENTTEFSALTPSSSNADHELSRVDSSPDTMNTVKNEETVAGKVPKNDSLAVNLPPQFDVMEIIKSQMGNDKLAYKGYVYRKDKRYMDRIAWRCEQRNCRGRASTPIELEEYEGQDVVTVTQLHSHPASAARVEVVKARTKALIAATTGSQPPQEIVATVVAGLSEEALSEIGSARAFIQAIKRKRRLLQGPTCEVQAPAGQIVQDCYGNEFMQF